MKTFEGVVVSTKMQKTTVVEIVRTVKHPLYKKLLRKKKGYKVDTGDFTVLPGDRVKIAETKPISKDKHFKIIKVLDNNAKKETKMEKVNVSKRRGKK